MNKTLHKQYLVAIVVNAIKILIKNIFGKSK